MPSTKEPGRISYFVPNLTNNAYAQNSNEESLDEIVPYNLPNIVNIKILLAESHEIFFKRKGLSPGRFSSLVMSCR